MSDFLSFSLSNDFIEPYKTKDVPWGFNIGGGNSLSELTFVLKYSRKKEDGTKEQWWEVCRRCVEGYYSILKDHAKARKTHWNDQKAQRSAEDAFDRMFNFKWTPPGRGMQHMGTEYIAKSGNGARLINCLAGETEVVTRRGIFPIEELSGETHTLLTSDGWVEAPISNFGEQELYEITLSRSGAKKKIRATANHRWFTRDKRKSNDASFEETLTKDLVPGVSQLKGIHGDVVKLTYSHPVDENRWCVESVIPTGTIENVYCATVEGVGNFALSDNILTGNCAAVTTEKLSTGSTYAATRPFVLLMEMSANGVGVGFDVRGAGNITLHQPDTENSVTHVIEDTREAWAESLGVLLESFFFKNRKSIKFDYSKIRPEGTPLKSFGGVASGPRSLMKMHDKITDLLSNRDGEPLSSRDIVDIMNLAGKCIVSGGSRRCLPTDTQVKTTDGSKAIQDILVGDIISTPEGEYPVTNVFAQGEQELVKITHAFGEFECTPNHRMAVWDSVESWSFKEASELTEEDRLVWDYSPWAGSPQKLPELSLHRQFDGSYIRNSGKRGVGKYPDIGCSIDNCDRSASVKSPSNWDGPLCNTHYMRLGKFGDPLTFRGWGRVVNLPEYVTEDFAWLAGVIHGDGNVTISSESKAVLRIPFDDKYPELMLKAERILSEIMPDTNMKWRQGDGKYQILSVSNARFVNWLGKNVKLPKEPIRIPDWIKNAESNIRAAYLAGVFDTDGSQSPRTFRSASTVYEEFAKDLQELWMIQGVAATIRVVDRSAYGWQTLYNVDIAGGEFKEAAYRSMLAYSSSKLADFELPKRSGPRMLSYSSAQAVASGIPKRRTRANRYGAIGVMAVTELMDVTPKAYPVPIMSVALSRTAQTYDIEVADIHQFTANGFVTHNSALLSLGYKDDKEFINLKNWEIEENSERMGSDGWGHLSNNSVIVNVGDDLSEITEQIAVNGEPGILWSDLSQDYGRLTDLKDCKDQRGILVNPCAEISLENAELCCLSEIYPTNHGDTEDLKHTIKHAYMYTKAVSMLQTPWPETNEVIMRNHRIGVSMTGIAQFVETRGWQEMANWFNEGYRYISAVDKKYSEWLGVRESIRLTTVKPAGSTSLVTGVTPGVHWPTTSGYHIRRIRFNHLDPLLDILREAGYHAEPDVMDPNSTVVVSFPTEGIPIRSEREVSIWEKASLAALAQRYWSDNLVSCTLSFRPDEKDQLKPLLSSFQGQLKSASFLPIDDSGTTYAQAPYEPISEDDAKTWMDKIVPIDASRLYGTGAAEFVEDKFCTTDSCEISF